ncbi:hypothetical protein [Paenibacillus contaminans]|uniref:Uncharacterized protein n=1 Tax=Paenibacillus contaminans TaxID=450362 RepID=A0A329MTP3_9BACL|nr:hypothetical protein [Paenibacillus contaminans]RAV22982.1 hypothetical protein DQG23_01900 [Paenibacillus contaminans]
MKIHLPSASPHFGKFGVSSFGSQEAGKHDKNDKHDSISISKGARNLFSKLGPAKTNGIMESLMKQKEKLQENKNNLIERTLDKGDDISTIKNELKDFDERIRKLDELMNQHLLDERNKTLGKDEDQKQKADASQEKPLTEQEQQQKQTDNLIGMAGSFEQIRNLGGLRTKLQGETVILKKEIELDEARSLSGQLSSSKREKLSDMEDAIAKIDQRIGKLANSVDETIKDNSEQAHEAKSEEEAESIERSGMEEESKI